MTSKEDIPERPATRADSEPDIYRPVLVDSVRARLKRYATAERRSMQNAANWGLSEFLKQKGF